MVKERPSTLREAWSLERIFLRRRKGERVSSCRSFCFLFRGGGRGYLILTHGKLGRVIRLGGKQWRFHSIRRPLCRADYGLLHVGEGDAQPVLHVQHPLVIRNASLSAAPNETIAREQGMRPEDIDNVVELAGVVLDGVPPTESGQPGIVVVELGHAAIDSV